MSSAEKAGLRVRTPFPSGLSIAEKHLKTLVELEKSSCLIYDVEIVRIEEMTLKSKSNS